MPSLVGPRQIPQMEVQYDGSHSMPNMDAVVSQRVMNDIDGYSMLYLFLVLPTLAVRSSRGHRCRLKVIDLHLMTICFGSIRWLSNSLVLVPVHIPIIPIACFLGLLIRVFDECFAFAKRACSDSHS